MNAEIIHPAAMPEEKLTAACRFERLRRSGPGGQHRNKVETAVRVTHLPTDIRAEASERRSQDANRKKAIFRLRLLLALEVRMKRDEEATPSSTWRSHMAGTRIRCSDEHTDFPSLLAESLDVLAMNDFDVRPAAQLFGCTVSQLVRFLSQAPRALALINAERQSRGKTTLRA